MFNNKYDSGNCIVDIHSGAGGEDACDWALMLFRMYTRFFDKKGYKYDVIDYLDGDGAGIKRASNMLMDI